MQIGNRVPRNTSRFDSCIYEIKEPCGCLAEGLTVIDYINEDVRVDEDQCACFLTRYS